MGEKTGPKPGTKQSPEHIAHKAAAQRKYGPPAHTIPEYRIWCEIKTRCFNPRRKQWKDYGGRGITMSPEWRDSFSAFLRDMGPRPPGMTIDRIDNDGIYEAGNCRWTTREIQRRNSRVPVQTITLRGQTRSVKDWATQLGMNQTTLRRRLHEGYPLKRALDPAPLPPINHVKTQSPEHIAKRMAATRRLTVNGQTHTVSEWAAILGISAWVINDRLRKGWAIEDVLRSS